MDNGVRVLGYGLGLVGLVAVLFVGLRAAQPSGSSSSNGFGGGTSSGGGTGVGFWGSIDWGGILEDVWGLLGSLGGGGGGTSSGSADDVNWALASGGDDPPGH